MFIALTGARMPVWQTDFVPDLFGSSRAEKMDNRNVRFRCSEVFEARAGHFRALSGRSFHRCAYTARRRDPYQHRERPQTDRGQKTAAKPLLRRSWA